LEILNHMEVSTKRAKGFARQLLEDYKAKNVDICEAYHRFEAFTDSVQNELTGGKELADLTSLELRFCYEEYKDDEKIRQAWENSGAEGGVMVQSMMSGCHSFSSTTSPDEKRVLSAKGKKLKVSEIVDMQVVMVDELQRLTQALTPALNNDDERLWKPEVMVQLFQALAHGAVERRHGVSVEEMAIVGFQYTQQLERNERFVKATEKQQELLNLIPRLCERRNAGKTGKIGSTASASS